MKKTFILSFSFILLGVFCANMIHNKLYGLDNKENLYYFIQQGVYSSKDSMIDGTKNLENKLVTKNNDKYYVYLGITKDRNNVSKISKLYKSRGYDIYYKEMYINNTEFSNNVSQFDKLISDSNEMDEILAIENVVLANYQEINENK